MEKSFRYLTACLSVLAALFLCDAKEPAVTNLLLSLSGPQLAPAASPVLSAFHLSLRCRKINIDIRASEKLIQSFANIVDI